MDKAVHFEHHDHPVEIPGVITIRNYQIETMEAMRLDNFLGGARWMEPCRFRKAMEELREMYMVRELVVHNRVVIGARSEMAKRLANVPDTTGAVNYGALGTSSAAVTDLDVQLAAEVFRKPIGSATLADDNVTFDFYYTKTETSGTYQEFAAYIDGTAAANSGLMFDRVLTGGWGKSLLEAMTVSLQIDINAT